MSFDETVFQPKPQGSLRQGVRLNGIFEIEELIAEGGMGEVYKGVAIASGDPVAIKLVRPEMGRDPDVMALFKREAAILHDLLHEAIVRYYVFSLEPELQRYYIAMEFVDGVSLQKRLAEGPLSPAEVRILLKRIGGALQQAHERGVVHRDISSDNIILPGGDARKAKIVDFGIARATRPGEGTILNGGFAGKYKYVSPEQVGLMGGEVTPKSDIYSFGLVLAEALRGQPLDMGGTQAEVVEKRRVLPDLSGVDVSLRPLLTAMLAPDPRDRPGSMAEIAAWGEGATLFQTPATAPAAARKRGGAVAAIAAAAVVAAAGAGAYFLRHQLGLAGQPVVATTATPSPPALSSTSPPTPAASTPTPVTTAAQGPVVTADALLDEMPPKPASSVVALAPAMIGAPYRAELPAFSDPAGKGLVLHAAPAPPAGLALKPLGGGRSEIAGEPKAAGDAAFDVVAVTQAGKSGRMKVTMTVNPRPQAPPPQPAQSAVQLEPATAGTSYSAGLPPFRSPQAVTLRAGPGLPAGLTLNDLGNGLSQLAGEPKTPGAYAFDVIAATAAGAQGRMNVRIEVAARPVETPTAQASPSPQASPSTPSPSPTVATVETPAVTPAAFKQAVRAEADLRGYVVRPSQCPAVDLLAAASSPGKGLPRVVLDSPLVGAGRPLSGTILGLAGRPLLLLVIDDDGNAFRLRAQASPGGESATFSASFTGDPSSIGKPQMVIAVASDQPIDANQKIDGARSADLMPKLAAAGRDAGAGFALFKFVQ